MVIQLLDEEEEILARIRAMGEDEVDALLEDENSEESEDGFTLLVREACFRRLAELQGKD